MLLADFDQRRMTSASVEPFQTSRTCVVVVAATESGRRSRKPPIINPADRSASRVVAQRQSRHPT